MITFENFVTFYNLTILLGHAMDPPADAPSVKLLGKQLIITLPCSDNFPVQAVAGRLLNYISETLPSDVFDFQLGQLPPSIKTHVACLHANAAFAATRHACKEYREVLRIPLLHGLSELFASQILHAAASAAGSLRAHVSEHATAMKLFEITICSEARSGGNPDSVTHYTATGYLTQLADRGNLLSSSNLLSAGSQPVIRLQLQNQTLAVYSCHSEAHKSFLLTVMVEAQKDDDKSAAVMAETGTSSSSGSDNGRGKKMQSSPGPESRDQEVSGICCDFGENQDQDFGDSRSIETSSAACDSQKRQSAELSVLAAAIRPWLTYGHFYQVRKLDEACKACDRANQDFEVALQQLLRAAYGASSVGERPSQRCVVTVPSDGVRCFCERFWEVHSIDDGHVRSSAPKSPTIEIDYATECIDGVVKSVFTFSR